MNFNRYIAAGIASLAILLGIVLTFFLTPSNPVEASHAHTAGSAANPIYLPLISKPPAPVSVSLLNLAYNPQAITVTVGTTIKWTNNESLFIPHSVTSGIPPFAPDGKFDSGTLNPGQSFQFTFNSVGTFAYYCQFHLAMMTGTVTVIP